MDSMKIQIGLLEGKSNWSTWKYKVTILLRSIPGALDVVEGKVKAPAPLRLTATASEKDAYNKQLDIFNKIDSNALLVLTTNMTEETLKLVMRFSSSIDVWKELNRLFDGSVEDRAFDLCLNFFSYKRETGDDIASHTSKLKNVWNDLKLELTKGGSSDLPELLLICKILDTLPEDYFSFRSSWMLVSKKDRTLDNLTTQLCMYERALHGKENSNNEVLVSQKSFSKSVKPKDQKQILVCKYCKGAHKITYCSKWKADGKPQPQTKGNKPVFYKPKDSSHGVVLFASTNYVLNTEQDRDHWHVDNGSFCHIANRKDIFVEYTPFDNNNTPTVTTANGDSVKAEGKGSIEVQASVNGKWKNLTLMDVWYVPDIKKNLFSPLAAQDRNPNSEFISSSVVCQLKINGEIVLFGSRNRFGGLYKLALRNVFPNNIVTAVSNENILQLYHERFAHQNKRHVKSKIKSELGIVTALDSELCEGCIFGKSHRQKFGTREKPTRVGELISTDVCGPFDVPSKSGYKYYVLFKDEYSRYRFVYFIKEKSDVSEKLKLMLAEVDAAGYNVKEILSDNGEFDCKAVRLILQEKGIVQRLTMPYTPQQNPCERENRTIVEAARTYMHSRNDLPKSLWAELVNTATHVLNRTGPSSVPEKSPYELWHGKRPYIKHLRIIGSDCYAHVPKTNRKKLDAKAIKGILIGYDTDGYRIWCPQKNTLIRSRDVVFNEKTLYSGDGIIVTTPTETTEESPQITEDSSQITEDSTQTTEDLSDCEVEIEEEFKENRRVLRDRNTIKLPQRFDDFVMYCGSSIMSDYVEPNTYEEAMECQHSKEWKKAMDEEMNSLLQNGTWNLEKLPADKKAIPCKWVYKIKTNPDGTIERFKARLVIKGYKQKKGVDYDQTFSPVAKLSTVRTLISIAANEQLQLTQFDISSAFLNGYLDNKGSHIYMEQPVGYNDKSGQVCRLKKSLYGLKQGPRCWNQRFINYLIKLNFKQSEADPCLFILEKSKKKLILTIFVDDGLVASNDPGMMSKFLNDLEEEFRVTSKPACYYLGLQIQKLDDGIKLSQTGYAKKVLNKLQMQDCKPVQTPIVNENSESGKENCEITNLANYSYRQVVGALMYLMIGSRPDIAFAVGVVSRSLENPTNKDWIQVKRILRYIKGTADQGIIYKTGYKSGILECFSDADHAGDTATGRSTSGVVCLYSGGCISWLSQRQSSVAISTTEAEIVAASEAAKEAIWLKRIMAEIITLQRIPELQLDNEAALRLSQNPEFHKRTKHIRTRHFFVRELVSEGEINVKKISSEGQLADIMTKPLPRPRHLKLCNEIGLSAANVK